MTEKDTIHFIITGGTIDSYYDGTKDTVVPRKESIIPELLTRIRLYEKMEFTTICMKDSRELNQDDLKNILKTIEQSRHKKIIITHGTYTMPDTSRYVQEFLKRKDQTIVFTGSMAPIDGFSFSDGTFNLGYAIAQVMELKPGQYVCMNGATFDPNEIIKFISEGRYASLFSEK